MFDMIGDGTWEGLMRSDRGASSNRSVRTKAFGPRHMNPRVGVLSRPGPFLGQRWLAECTVGTDWADLTGTNDLGGLLGGLAWLGLLGRQADWLDGLDTVVHTT